MLNQCLNCGKDNHLYIQCDNPIISCGIICYRFNQDKKELEYLIVQRKHSIEFIDYVRGKYPNNQIQVEHLFENMTVNEKYLLATESFDNLWNNIWLNKTNDNLRIEYHNACKKFENNRNELNKLLKITKNKNGTLEWGFPKGRRERNETNYMCAIREFVEETGYTNFDVENENFTLTEEFIGTNKTAYNYVYYIAKGLTKKNIQLNMNNYHQYSEIGNIGWYTYTEILAKVNNFRRCSVLRKVQRIIQNNYFRNNCGDNL